MILVPYFHIPAGFQLRKNVWKCSVHTQRRPWISIVCSNESEKHKLEINSTEKYRYWGSQNIFHLNCRGISRQKKIIFNGTFFFLQLPSASSRGLVVKWSNVPISQKNITNTNKKLRKFKFCNTYIICVLCCDHFVIDWIKILRRERKRKCHQPQKCLQIIVKVRQKYILYNFYYKYSFYQTNPFPKIQ